MESPVVTPTPTAATAAATTAANIETLDKNVPPKKSKAKLLQSQSMDACSSKDDEVSPNPVGRPRKSPSLQEEATAQSSNPGMESSEGKSEQKAQQKPGKYVCDYCGRACAKPSVLKKHIRSHTGERPYPCVPCGFSFKTKSNLYKHRKSHAHSVKAGTLTEAGTYGVGSEHGSFDGEGDFSDGDQTTDTDDDTGSDPLLLLDTECSDNTAVKVLNLISQKRGTTASSAAHEHQETGLSPSTLEPSRAIPSSAIKQRLALRLSEKRSSDSEHNLSLPSQSSKGSTDSGYFSRSESSEHQTGPPNTNAKSYQEIMFGKCYRPSPKQAYASEYKDSDRGVSRVYTQEKDIVESIKINTKSFTREEIKEPEIDIGLLMRSNSMPTSSAVCLPTPQALRGSHSFDERTSTGGSRRLRRQAAFECSAHETHADTAEGHVKISETGIEMENYPSMSHLSYHRQAMELATRKRRKEKREEEELPIQYESHHEQSEEFMYEADFKAKEQAMCEMDVTLSAEISTRKTLGNVISVIQHTNSLNRIQMEQGEHYKCHSSQYYQAMEASEGYEMERSDSRLRQSFQMGPKLIRQPNIQVPEIRVTVEPDSPEKAPVVQVKEPEKHVVEEFQWPQRSETLAQFPPEKLPPKKKRFRLAEIEHSSGESSFESACTSLSRSPSQDSNLSYSSTYSFDREDSIKSPGKQDEFGKELLAVPGSSGPHSLSLLHQRQQHEMRRSSSEQAPCNLRKELPEVRSISFDYGSLSPTSKLKLVDYANEEKRRANLVRQESLNMETESTHQISHQFLTQSLPIFSTGSTFPHLPHPSLLVPVRIQTNVPSFGSLTYTMVSQMLDNQSECISLCSPNLQYPRGPDHQHSRATSDQTIDALDSAKLKTGIPLSLTSRTISTTNASSGGASKRMLSPASSLDLVMEVKQQKRVKEERMFGEIAEELSAVELGKCNVGEDRAIQRATEDRSSESPMDSSAMDVVPMGEAKEVKLEPQRFAMDVVAKLATVADVKVVDRERAKALRQFPSLRTTTGVSWCYLNYTKPSCSQSSGPPFPSAYAVWCVSAHNPNPLDLSTGAALALLRSKQKGGSVVYSAAQMSQPGSGKLVSSLLLWRNTMEQLQRKPEPRDTEGGAYGKKPKDARPKAGKDEWKEAPGQSAPARIKIFEGGYKSNEDYVYVRGRGRGKYICEECGIRCKKPSMLKKHIRTHTDVRPYVCKVCNFAFKTKGNLTKHMKSKAHMKKCLELGVSVSMDEAELQEQVDDVPLESKVEASAAKHQFSDAEDSDGGEEEELDEEDEEEDDYDGDSTPKLRSPSTSPQPSVLPSAIVTALPGGGVAGLSASAFLLGAAPRRCSYPPPPSDDDSLTLLSPDQSFLFDPYSSCLLSPGWESPIREPSPSRPRYPSPRREMSPRGRSTPRWDTSPLRPGSPSFSPIQHLSPAAMERPLSPGCEAGKRGRQRVVLRAVSPRRGTHQHKGDKSRQQAKMEVVQQQHGAHDMELDQKPVSAPPLPPNLLSHLPLHSQHTQRSLLPARPVGAAQTPPCSPSATPDAPPASSSPRGSETGLEGERTATPSRAQEENVQTCLKAIASLTITAEEQRPH
ncbi:transcription factor HIVEP2 [Eucyclogobius newberryi]|uniref:transcription factor HIVEP2 n=1 Tax=Eucyclogobius newberryi TaxID=166745 RepID=UPI003B5BDF84